MKTSELLKLYGIKLNKNLGQNFLSNISVAEKIVNIANVKDDDVILEIGAGAGTLTEALLKTGAFVYAVEIDLQLKDVLYRLKHYKNLHLIFDDILKLDLSFLPENFRCISNIPYSITGHVIKKILFSNFFDAYLMVQKEVGERLLSKPGDSNRGFLTVVVQSICEIKKVLNVSKSNFVPNPEIDSSVIFFKKKKESLKNENLELYWQFVSNCFRQKRKTLRNNLKTFLNKEQIELLEKEIDLTKRPEDISERDFLKMWKIVYKKPL
ncbi:ribosomal RNA small subunit methyltransferase A [Thermosipho ferrireducens]|uniref:Ribosomal RNA small subunit methyltransferase A n=1 Tax=Thermosipho ferrireducens TaxID=2571116 RepID=A0ABX7S769_9BACT|nr:16S rRNA (adenine(1518)-N(6)/adenine(1519)-N(6))-dimethyltransferase RsmA [Thermosipho ferrireducens]QTA37111.1 ribosomal RNA small subunit methyltransferase A [Thermosipho ferrireducens]